MMNVSSCAVCIQEMHAVGPTSMEREGDNVPSKTISLSDGLR